MSAYTALWSKLLFLLPPETAHRVALRLLGAVHATPPLRTALRRACVPRHDEQRLLGLRFRNRIGLAAGFDKSARHVSLVADLGFGFLEVGSITARATAGNARPRLFRVPRERALVNWMGLNNDGAGVIAARLGALERDMSIPVFANVARTPGGPPDEADGIADYVASVDRVRSVADAVVLNVSCPNTGDGRTFEEPAALDTLLEGVREVLPPGRPPLLVKLSADVDPAETREAVSVARAHDVDGFVAINTTVDRSILSSGQRFDRGGVSGEPLRRRALETVELIAKATSGEVPIIGVGGVSRPEHVADLRHAGAWLIEVYTGFVYRGPRIVRELTRG